MVDKIRDSYCRSTTSGYVFGKGNDEEVDAYVNLRSLLLNREVGNKQLAGDVSEIELRITWGTKVAVYTHPTNPNINGVIDLEGIEEPNIRAAVKEYYRAAGAEKYHYSEIAANSKGRKGGAAPLAKNPNDTALKKLSHDHDHVFAKLLPQILTKCTDPKDRMIVTRRLLFVEHFQKKMIERIDLCIGIKTTALQEAQAAGAEPGVVHILQNEKDKFEGLKDNVENIDLYALCKVLLHYPTENPSNEDVNRLANFLEHAVCEEIYNQGASWRDKIPIGKKRELTEAQKEYAKDVVGMAFLDRGSYFDYCDQGKRWQKAEGLADLFLREALKFSVNSPDNLDGTYSPNGEYKAEGFQKSIFLNEFPELLKLDIKRELSQLGVLATHTIGQRNAGEYETADEATLKGHIAAHRSRVLEAEKKYRTHADLPQPANPGPLAAPVVDLGPIPGPGALTAATAVVTAGTELAPAIIEGGSRAIQAIGSWMPQSVANGAGNLIAMAPAVPKVVVNGLRSIQAITPLVTQPVMSVVRAVHDHPIAALGAATVADSVYSYVRPMERGPDGVARRRFKPKRALGMTAVGTAGALALYHAPQAALQSVVAAADGLKDWIFIPANVGIKLVGGLLVAEKVAKTVGSNIKERQFFKLSCLLGAGTLALLMYRAVNDGVVDNSVLEIAGNWVGSQLTAVADTAYHLYNYSSATRAASMVGVSGLLAWNEGKPIKTGAIEGLFAIPMGGMPLNQLVIAGGAAADRTLPPKAAAIITVPADAAKRFTGNISMVKNGQMLGGLVVGVWGLAGKLFGKASEMAGVLGKTYEQMRATKTPVMSLI